MGRSLAQRRPIPAAATTSSCYNTSRPAVSPAATARLCSVLFCVLFIPILFVSQYSRSEFLPPLIFDSISLFFPNSFRLRQCWSPFVVCACLCLCAVCVYPIYIHNRTYPSFFFPHRYHAFSSPDFRCLHALGRRPRPGCYSTGSGRERAGQQGLARYVPHTALAISRLESLHPSQSTRPSPTPTSSIRMRSFRTSLTSVAGHCWPATWM